MKPMDSGESLTGTPLTPIMMSLAQELGNEAQHATDLPKKHEGDLADDEPAGANGGLEHEPVEPRVLEPEPAAAATSPQTVEPIGSAAVPIVSSHEAPQPERIGVRDDRRGNANQLAAAVQPAVAKLT